MKRYWLTLFVIIASALIYRLLGSVLPGSLQWIMTPVYAAMLLVIGSFLVPVRKKNNRWLGKVIIALVVVFIVGYRMGVLVVPQFTNLLNLAGLNGVFLDILLIYCGWAFFQV